MELVFNSAAVEMLIQELIPRLPENTAFSLDSFTTKNLVRLRIVDADTRLHVFWQIERMSKSEVGAAVLCLRECLKSSAIPWRQDNGRDLVSLN